MASVKAGSEGRKHGSRSKGALGMGKAHVAKRYGMEDANTPKPIPKGWPMTRGAVPGQKPVYPATPW